MGLDVGERRIGVAIADELGTIASPLAIVERGEGDLAEIEALAAARGVSHLVVGLPTGLSGREGPQAATVRAFAEALETAVAPDIQVEFWDERLTTTVAERALREGGGRRNRRKGEIDAVAAAVILQGYLDARRSRARRQQNPDGGYAL
jgi:putative holliday junction resolvase